MQEPPHQLVQTLLERRAIAVAQMREFRLEFLQGRLGRIAIDALDRDDGVFGLAGARASESASMS